MRWTVTAAAVAGVLVAALIIRTQVIDTVTVSSDSMAPTVCTGDTVLLARLHDGAAIDVDDIVTFPSPMDGQPAIKRVVAVAGETVAIQDAELIVDGSAVPEPYVDHASIDGVYTATFTVPQGSVFVLGDHREISIDSREYGPIPISIIEGRMIMKLWSACATP